MRKGLFIILLVLIVLGSAPRFILADTKQPTRVSEGIGLERALDASLVISMTFLEPGSQPSTDVASNTLLLSSRAGLGTLVLYDNEYLIITHNHWMLSGELELVQFRNRWLQLVAQVTGQEFLRLIRYRDEGTLVLSKPADLDSSVKAVPWSNVGALQTGVDVQVVYRRRAGTGGIAAIDATLLALEEKNGVPTMLLRCPSGHILIPGDSGGGIWYEERLVGNLWASLVMEVAIARSPQENGSDVVLEENWSRAAMLMSEVQEQLSPQEGVSDQVGVSQPGLSRDLEPGLASPNVREGVD